MTPGREFFIIFFSLFKIFNNVCCENYSVNPFNFHLNKKAEFDSARISKENIFENPLQKNINDRRRLLFNEENPNSAFNSERGENTNDFAARRTNFSESENEKISDWGNVGLQFPVQVNSENSRNFGDVSIRPPIFGVKNSNQRFDWEKKSDVFEKTHSRWNEEKNFQFPNQNFERNPNNGRFGVINNGDMNQEDGRVSITTLNEPEMGNMRGYNDERVGNIHATHMGHSHMNHRSRNPNSFWSPNFFKPEKEVVINLKTECSTPRHFNNQLVHKFIFTPKTPISTHSEFAGFQIPEPAYISSHKMTPMYYL